MSIPKKKATILDISAAAGVSPATVSRVLNNVDYPISNDLRTRVLLAAKELNYKPNIFSQMLRGISSKEIGIIVPDLSNPFYSQLISTVARECVQHGYAPIVCSSFNSSALESRQIEILLRQQVAGIILSTLSDLDDCLEQLDEPEAPPVILFDQAHHNFAGDSVYFDFEKGGYMAAEYLINCGHRDIAFASRAFDRTSRKMLYDGYCKALEVAGISLNQSRIFINTQKEDGGRDLDFDNGKILGKMMLKSDVLPQAVMAVNDVTAIGIMDVLLGQGVRIPEDISVMGFDNIPYASMVSPALTTIDQSASKTGKEAAEMLFHRIAFSEEPQGMRVVEPELVIRKSVATRS